MARRITSISMSLPSPCRILALGWLAVWGALLGEPTRAGIGKEGQSRFAGSSLRRPKICGARRAAQGRSMGCRPRPAQRSAARRAFGRRGLFTSRYSAEIIIEGRGRGEFPINGRDAAAGQFPRGASDSGVHEARKVPPGS